MDFNKIAKELKAIQTKCICSTCNITYPKAWYNTTYKMCFYCTHFLPMRDTRYSILHMCEWYFIKSGNDEINRDVFYKEYVEYASLWCNKFGIISKKEDKELEKELI